MEFIVEAKRLKAVASCAAKEKMRYALNHVRVSPTKDGVEFVATDGRALLALSLQFKWDWGSGYLNPAPLARARGNERIAFRDAEVVMLPPYRGSRTSQTIEARLPTLWVPEANAPGPFPNWKEVMPQDPTLDNNVEQGINPALFGKVTAAAAALGFECLRLRRKSREAAIHLHGEREGDEGKEVVDILQMPMTLGD